MDKGCLLFKVSLWVIEDYTCLFLRIAHKLLLILTLTIIIGRIPITSLPRTDFPDKSDSEVNHANIMRFPDAVILKKELNMDLQDLS